jgi:tetratricopeptide (TPR) repeat protein
MPALSELIRASGPDPRVLAESLRPLWPHLIDASPGLRAELRDLAIAAWSTHYEIGEPHDVAFDLGLLLYGVQSWDDARRLFEVSLRSHGRDAATHWNLGLSHLALGDADAAMTAFHEARELAPGLNAAGPVTIKLKKP